MFKVLIVVAALTVVSLEAARGVGKKMNGDKDGLNTVRGMYISMHMLYISHFSGETGRNKRCVPALDSFHICQPIKMNRIFIRHLVSWRPVGNLPCTN